MFALLGFGQNPYTIRINDLVMLDVIQNIILGISLAAPVGPVNVEVIKRGLKHGFFPAFLLSLGAASADTTYLLLIYFGLSNFINIPMVKTSIWIFGAIVLLYLGYQSIKEYFEKLDLEKSKVKTRRNSFAAGYMITISNPMTIVWWLGVFGAILSSTIQTVTKTTALLNSLTIIVGVVLWFFALSILLHWGKRFVNEKTMRCISIITGLILIGFGLYFGYNAVVIPTIS